MARLRTFIGVDIGTAIRDRAVALQDVLARTAPGVKWVEPENIHVTLLFLGEVVDKEAPDVCRVVAERCQNRVPFTLTAHGLGCFPTPRRPRVVWIGVGEGAKDLCAIHDDLEAGLSELGCYRREERLFKPHITLGRVKGSGGGEELTAALAKHANWHGGATEVREVLVMSSQLQASGPTYAVLSRAKLKG